MKYEITAEEIRSHEDYIQAEKVAALIVIPKLSEDAQNYLDALTAYSNITRDINSTYSNRFSMPDMYAYDPGVEEFNNNLEAFKQIESQIANARYLHELIVDSVNDGLHKQLLEEQIEIRKIITGRDMITANAFKAIRSRLEDYAKTTQQLAKKKAREEARQA